MAQTSSIEDDSEWEYEYDDTQTEIIYVTVDLPYQRAPEMNLNDLASKETRLRPGTEVDSDKNRVGQSSDDGEVEDGEEQPQAVASDEEELGDEFQGDEDSQPDFDPQIKPTPPRSLIQILDLHSRNPLISCNDQVYSCTWGKTIGTDLIFARSGSCSKTMMPLIQEQGFDLMTASRIKLSGKPVFLERKKNLSTTVPLSTLVGQADALDSVFVNSNSQEMSRMETTALAQAGHSDLASANTNPPADIATAHPVTNNGIPTTSIRDPQSEAHIQERNAWLQRFSEIRRQRGESINIPIRVGKSYINWVPQPAEKAPTEVSVGNATTSDPYGSGRTTAGLARPLNHQTVDEEVQPTHGGVRPGTSETAGATLPRDEPPATLPVASEPPAATRRGRGRGGRRAGRARAGSRGRGGARLRRDYETRSSSNLIDMLAGVDHDSKDTPMPDV